MVRELHLVALYDASQLLGPGQNAQGDPLIFYGERAGSGPCPVGCDVDAPCFGHVQEGEIVAGILRSAGDDAIAPFSALMARFW